MKRFILMVGSLLLIVFSASCVSIVSADLTFDLAKLNAWNADLTLIAPGAPQTAGPVAVMRAMNQLKENIIQSGGRATIEQVRIDENGNTPFKLEVRSAPPNAINQILGNPIFTVQVVNGQRQVYFSMSSAVINAQNLTVTVKGKKILSHNGIQVNDSTVRWINPRGSMEAVIIEGSPVNWLGWLLVIGGIGLVSTAGLLASKGRLPFPFRRKPNPYQPVEDIFWNDSRPGFTPAGEEYHRSSMPPDPATRQGTTKSARAANPASYCPHCGTSLPPGAGFCPDCGNAI